MKTLLYIFTSSLFLCLHVFTHAQQTREIPARLTMFQFSGNGLDKELVQRIEIEFTSMLYDFASKCPRSLELVERGMQGAVVDFGRNLDQQYRDEYDILEGPQPVPAKANTFIFVKLQANNFGVLARMDLFDRNGKKLAGSIYPTSYAANALYEHGNRKDLMEQLIQKSLKPDRMRMLLQHFDPKADLSCFGGEGGGGETNSSTPVTQKVGEVEFTLKGCKRVGRNLTCDFDVISKFQDRELMIKINYGGISYLYDDKNNEYEAKGASINNVSGHSQFASRRLVADIPARCSLSFENISTQATRVSLLEIAVSIDKENSQLQFRDLPLK